MNRGAEKGNDRLELLRPSLIMENPQPTDPTSLRPVVELFAEAVLTCLCFGQEMSHEAYTLLACGSRAGSVVLYRIYRTNLEVQMMYEGKDEKPGRLPDGTSDGTKVEVHSGMVGHSKDITSIFFTPQEDILMTASLDKTLRLWSVDSGEMLKYFEDQTAILAAAFLPSNPTIFAASSSATLRLLRFETQNYLQQRVEIEQVRTIQFDDTGLSLIAGTGTGNIHVLQVADIHDVSKVNLKFKFMVKVANDTAVTCLTFVSAVNGRPPCLLVSSCDSSASIWDCISEDGMIQRLCLRFRFEVAHEVIPALKNCHSPSANGYFISASEDGFLYICDLKNQQLHYVANTKTTGTGTGTEGDRLVPVVSVAVNHQDTLMATSDGQGDLVLWRRFC